MQLNRHDDPQALARVYIGLGLFSLVCIAVVSIFVAAVFGTTVGVVVLSIGVVAVVTVIVTAVGGERAHYHYRHNLREQAAANRINAETKLIEARADALMLSNQPAVPSTRLIEPIRPSANPRIFVNGVEHHSDDDDDVLSNSDTVIDDDDDVMTDAPMMSGRMTESQADHAVRIRNLAQRIYEICRDADPLTQKIIESRIPMQRGGLLRGHGDITEALDALANIGQVTPAVRAGVARRWMRYAKAAQVVVR